MNKPLFNVVDRGGWPVREGGTFTLVTDNWDDYHFKTSYFLYFWTGEKAVEVGAVKIAPRAMAKHDPHTELPPTFDQLNDSFYSLGQEREYYETLLRLPNGAGLAALRSLRDVAAEPSILEDVREEEAFLTSLLRNLPLRTVTTQFRRIVDGLPPLTPYKFSYSSSVQPDRMPAPHPLRLELSVTPGDMPPTNVHVLIGANGVGKSQLLRDFAAAAEGSDEALGAFKDELSAGDAGVADFPFTNAVHVAFSAFDRQDTQMPNSSTGRVEVHRVGLSDKDSASLEEQFIKGLEVCASGRRAARWQVAIDTLSNADSILAETLIRDVIGLAEDTRGVRARAIFSGMSSGHKIVVLTVTRLIQYVEERSLVLIDEPENHLHPPLLSALTRAISDLVIDRNGVAIVATHSPVVLQEVPRSCSWMLQRSGANIRASQLPTETFGESVSRLTSEVFRLDVNRTGFNQVLQRMLDQHGGSARDVLEALSEQLGGEGRFILSALEYQRGEEHV